jgi:hypothetical protein
MQYTTAVRLVTLSAALIASGFVQAATITRINEDPVVDTNARIVTTAISGGIGEPHSVDLRGNSAMNAIRWREFNDHPCSIEIRGRAVDNHLAPDSRELNQCIQAGFRGGGGRQNPGAWKAVGFENSLAGNYIGALRVCLNGNGTRVKGIAVLGRKVQASGELSGIRQTPETSLPNCSRWQQWAECPEGHVATGLVGHYEAGNNPRSLTGLALRCRPITTQQNGESLSLTGRASDLFQVSGFPGEAVTVRPGQGDLHALDTIRWNEKGDKPCVIRVGGHRIDNVNSRSTARSNKCGQRMSDDASTRIVSVTPGGNQFAIVGLRVCMNSQSTRIKGIQIESRTPGNETVREFDDVRQRNCGSNWQEWISCPTGQVATGLIAHYNNGRETPRSLTGLGLRCRAYQQ